MIWAGFTLAFFCFLRCSEFTYQGVSKFRPRFDLSANCVLFHPSLASPWQMSIILNRLLIVCSPSPLCALTAMHSYFLASCPRGPLFSFQSGRYLTRSAVVHLLREAARYASLPYKSLKGHSFCISAASTAAAAGLISLALGHAMEVYLSRRLQSGVPPFTP